MKNIFETLSIVLIFIGYFPYFKDILARKTKPHSLSWLVWAVLSAIAFGIQLTHKGGVGSLTFGTTFFLTFTVFLLALKYGEKNINDNRLVKFIVFSCCTFIVVSH